MEETRVPGKNEDVIARDVIDSRQIDIFTLSIKSNRIVGYRIELIDILYLNNDV